MMGSFEVPLTGWYYALCTVYQRPNDSAKNVATVEIGGETQLKAGFKIWETNTGGATVSEGFSTEYAVYQAVESNAVSSIAIAATTGAIASILF